MLDIKVTFDLQGLPNAIHELANALNYYCVTKSEPTNNFTDIDPFKDLLDSGKAEAPEAKRTRKRASRKTEPVAEEATPVDDVAPQATEPEPVKAPERVFTLKDISDAGIALMDQGKIADLMALLEKHRLPNLTAAKEEQYAAIAADLIALGAVIPEVEA